MMFNIRLRFAAATGAAAVGIFSGCLASRHQAQTYHNDEGSEVFNAAPYEDAEHYQDSASQHSSPALILPAPSNGFQEFPAGKPPALPPAIDEEPVPSAGLTRIRPISHEVLGGSCSTCNTCDTGCSTCEPDCGDSLLQKIQRDLDTSRYKMDQFKSCLKCKLDRLNPLNLLKGCETCDSCSTCDSGCCGDEVVLDGVVIGEYPMASYPTCNTCPNYGQPMPPAGNWQQPAWHSPTPHQQYHPHQSYQHQQSFSGQPPCNCQQQPAWQSPSYSNQNQYPTTSYAPQRPYGTQQGQYPPQPYVPQQSHYSQPYSHHPQYSQHGAPGYGPQSYARPTYNGQVYSGPTYSEPHRSTVPQYSAPQQSVPQYSDPQHVTPQLPEPQRPDADAQTRLQPGHSPVSYDSTRVTQTAARYR